MKLLQEIINPNTVNLTNTQQGVLIDMAISPTPEVAYETTNGSEQTVSARNTLRTLGLIKVGSNRAILTNNGHRAIVNFNLVDDAKQLTTRGQAVYDAYKKQTKTDQNDIELETEGDL